MTKCELNQIFLGEIVSVQNYGAFVKIPGCSLQGLIHRSQVSSAHVDNVAEVLEKGDQVWCKVIFVAEDGKIDLSMKHVNQGDGTDLDPNGIELQRDRQRRKNPGTIQHKAIQLEAVLNTICRKCGTKGHLSNDCFMSLDGKKYELIPEIEESEVAEPVNKIKEKKVEKKHKQKKKKKKSKKSKESMNNSNMKDKESSKRKKKRYSKEHKKYRKGNSSSDSVDSTSSSHDEKAHKRKHSEDHETRTKRCKRSKTKHSD